MTIRIAHISDTHLGYRAHYRLDANGRNVRAVDIEQAYARAIDSILANGPIDLVVHTGDVFHQSRPNWSAIVTFIIQTKRLAALDCPIIVIAGNHDMSQLRTNEDVFSVLRHTLPEVLFVTGHSTETIELPALKLQITAIPHGALAQEQFPAPSADPGISSILLTHGLAPTLIDAPRRESGETVLTEAVLAPGYDLILLGHFHLAEKIDRHTWYAGSTERIGWNDAKAQTGWSLVTITENGAVDVVRKPIPGREMVDVGIRNPEGMDARAIADEILLSASRSAQPGAMIRADLSGVDRSVRRSADAILRREIGERFLVIQTWAKDDRLAVAEDERLDRDLEPMQGLPELFTQFCAEEIPDADFRIRFLERGRGALEEAMQALEATNEAAE